MTIFHLATLAIALFLVGCSLPVRMSASGPDPVTGKDKTTHYTEHYDGAKWLVLNEVGLSARLVHERPNSGTLFVAGWNASDRMQRVTIYSFEVDGHEYRFREPAVGDLPPQQRGIEEESPLGRVRIPGYRTEIPIVINCSIHGQRHAFAVTLHRRTVDEQRKYFGPSGTPPYPWPQLLK